MSRISRISRISRLRGLWRPAGLSRDFQLFWVGNSVSLLGDRISFLVVPAVVVFLLGGSALDVGLISTAQYLAIPVLSLVAGALADRWDLRRMLIACDLVRFTAIAAIPVAYWFGFLRLPLLFGLVVVVSVATVFFAIGYMPAIAATVAQPDLVPANARMEGSRTVTELGGPAVAGGIYQLLGVAALLVDAVTYLISAVAVRAMRPFGERASQAGRGAATGAVAVGRTVLARARAGMRRNWADPVLRRSTSGTLLANIGGPIFVTQMPVLAYQGLDLSAGMFGIVLSVAAGGAVLGAVTATRVSNRLGSGRMLGLAMVCHSASGLGILAVPQFPAAVVLALTLSSYGFFFSWYNINSAAVRQARVPIREQTIIHGAYRTITWGVIPISTFVGGAVVSFLAQNMSILDAAKFTMLAATVIGISSIIPLAGMQQLLATVAPMEPEPAEAAEAAEAAEPAPAERESS